MQLQPDFAPTATDPDEPAMIAKEDIASLHFAHTDALATEAARRNRGLAIERACMLGNAHHGKVLIFFRDADGRSFRSDTTIWACDSQYVTLKAGASLPVRAITGIEFL